MRRILGAACLVALFASCITWKSAFQRYKELQSNIACFFEAVTGKYFHILEDQSVSLVYYQFVRRSNPSLAKDIEHYNSLCIPSVLEANFAPIIGVPFRRLGKCMPYECIVASLEDYTIRKWLFAVSHQYLNERMAEGMAGIDLLQSLELVIVKVFKEMLLAFRSRNKVFRGNRWMALLYFFHQVLPSTVNLCVEHAMFRILLDTFPDLKMHFHLFYNEVFDLLTQLSSSYLACSSSPLGWLPQFMSAFCRSAALSLSNAGDEVQRIYFVDDGSRNVNDALLLSMTYYKTLLASQFSDHMRKAVFKDSLGRPLPEERVKQIPSNPFLFLKYLVLADLKEIFKAKFVSVSPQAANPSEKYSLYVSLLNHLAGAFPDFALLLMHEPFIYDLLMKYVEKTAKIIPFVEYLLAPKLLTVESTEAPSPEAVKPCFVPLPSFAPLHSPQGRSYETCLQIFFKPFTDYYYRFSDVISMTPGFHLLRNLSSFDEYGLQKSLANLIIYCHELTPELGTLNWLAISPTLMIQEGYLGSIFCWVIAQQLLSALTNEIVLELQNIKPCVFQKVFFVFEYARFLFVDASKHHKARIHFKFPHFAYLARDGPARTLLQLKEFLLLQLDLVYPLLLLRKKGAD